MRNKLKADGQKKRLKKKRFVESADNPNVAENGEQDGEKAVKKSRKKPKPLDNAQRPQLPSQHGHQLSVTDPSAFQSNKQYASGDELMDASPLSNNLMMPNNKQLRQMMSPTADKHLRTRDYSFAGSPQGSPTGREEQERALGNQAGSNWDFKSGGPGEIGGDEGQFVHNGRQEDFDTVGKREANQYFELNHK